MAIDVVVQWVAGLDIAKASLVACVRVPGPRRGWTVHKRKFATTTKYLLELLSWLMEHQVTRVGMESTSGYWKPVFYVLEDHVECWLLNAGHMKAVSGRKTDMADAEWIADLVAHGLVRPSFVPPPPIRRLRDLTRRRTLLLAERDREKQRMEKLLEDAGVKAVRCGQRHFRGFGPGDDRGADPWGTRPPRVGRHGARGDAPQAVGAA